MQITIEGAEAMSVDLGEMPARATRAMVNAMNRAIQSGQTVMVREVARDTGLKSSDVRAAMPVQQATFGRPEAKFGASAKRLPLIKFRARGPEPSRGKGRGVSYANPGGGRSRIPTAFITTMRSGHRGVFRRVGKKRLPIVELFGPSLGHVFAKYRALGVARVEEVFEDRFGHELEFQKSGGNG